MSRSRSATLDGPRPAPAGDAPATPDAQPRRDRPWYQTFHDLMPYRVREILLVSSPYDAFTLEEDGQLTEHIFTEYSELNLSSAPRITHVSTAAGALEHLAERRFDLVMTMVRLPDMDVSAFGRRVKAEWGLPVVLLVLTEADLSNLPGGVQPGAIDRVFVWTGDARILLTIIKLTEDALNVESDTSAAGVRVIIVVEDSARRYSTFLGLLYSELMAQSESLVAEGVNDLHRLLRMRTRPKILLATTYEEALACYERFPRYVVAVVSDVRFSRGGVEDPGAGFVLVERMRSDDPELPVLLQSSEPANAQRAAELGVEWVDKNSTTLRKHIRNFVTENLGFGDFAFRLPDRTEVARARDLFELEQLVRTVPAASLEYHATRNHFSLWVMARSSFALAERMRSQKMAAFGDVEGVRRYLLEVLREERLRQQEGVIADFSSRRPAADSHLLRLGKGSIGGKARGIAFVDALLAREGLSGKYEGLRVTTPRSIVIGTQEFDRFVEQNRIAEVSSDARLTMKRCLGGRLSEDLLRNLRRAVADISGPLCVRSSSLLEDSQLQPFAGIYSTFILPNNHPDPEVRFDELKKAILAVYASTYSEDARAYIAGTPYSLEEEKMAVLIQETVGQAYGDRFYPAVSGVGLSYNYYPIGHQRAEDGLVLVALGLGHTIVSGRTALQFSPAHPGVLPQFSTTRDLLRYSQSAFYALDLGHPLLDFESGGEASLLLHDLSAAEADGTLALAGSVYSRDDDVVRDNLGLPGTRVVTFNNVLRWNAIPLAPALAEILERCARALGCPVEIEFALDIGDWGRAVPADRERRTPTLHILQVRPQATQLVEGLVEIGEVSPEEILCRTDRALGHGVIEDLRDVVYVKSFDLECDATPAVAEEVGRLNARLQAERVPYLLVGPGRWGSSDPRLGVPVKWSQIAGARVIVETSFADRDVEPSQGAHFFHNVTSFRIGYLTLLGASRESPAARRFIDMGWLEAQPVLDETARVRHVRLDRPLRVYLDGTRSSATILKPGP